MNISDLQEVDLYLYHQGTNFHAYEMLGAHFVQHEGRECVRFAVWAPHAARINVVGDFNAWDDEKNPMEKIADGEIWVAYIDGLTQEAVYKYAIEPQGGGKRILKADPYAFFAEKKPQTASKLYDISGYEWHDADWYAQKSGKSSYVKPMLAYEVHLGSWRRTLEGGYLSYRELADKLIDYVRDMHYTHIELMPLCEHPYDGSWGYQATGYYAVTSRYGKPEDFMYLVDRAHANGIGIIMDWVPGHFCKDEQGLRHFDGQNLYESDNEQRAENWEWGTTNFDYGRTEVHSFLISNALFWLEQYHIDGLRIDAVANMLYLNYARKDGEWQPNKYGDTGNLEAMEFIKKLNETVFKYHPHALMIAEESTSWPLVSKPVYMGGLGFNYKWNMGWMNDMLEYMELDPVYRKWHQDKITFSLTYAFSENFVLPLSHDEVVHGKKSLISKMQGDYWQQFAGLRSFFAFWMAHPGKKLLFMGGEFGQFIEWNFEDSLDWHLIEEYPMHKKMLDYSKALNGFYCSHKALWEIDFEWEGFRWIDCNDSDNSVISFIRKADNSDDFLVVVCNFTSKAHEGYRVGMPRAGEYVEVFNSDAEEFGGSGVKNEGRLAAEPTPWHGQEQSLALRIPPLAVIYLQMADKEVFSLEIESVAKTKVAKKKAPAKKKTAKKPAAKAAEPKAEVSAAVKKAPAKKRTTKKAVSEPKAAVEAAPESVAEPKSKAKSAVKKTPAKRRTAKKAAPAVKTTAESASLPEAEPKAKARAAVKKAPAKKRTAKKAASQTPQPE